MSWERFNQRTRQLRETEREARQLRQILLEKLEAEAKAKTAGSAPAIPSFEDDPVGHLSAKTDLVTQALIEIEGRTRKVTEKQDLDNYVAGARLEAARAVNDKDPDRAAADLTAAAAWLHGVRVAWHGYLGPQGAIAAANQEERSFIQHCRQAGLNPFIEAQAIAKNLGYRAAPPPPPAIPTAQARAETEGLPKGGRGPGLDPAAFKTTEDFFAAKDKFFAERKKQGKSATERDWFDYVEKYH